jgi:hypothetical protein
VREIDTYTVMERWSSEMQGAALPESDSDSGSEDEGEGVGDYFLGARRLLTRAYEESKRCNCSRCDTPLSGTVHTKVR